MSPNIFRDGKTFICTTDESPQQFKGVLLVCLAGKSPETVEEIVKPINELKELERIPIETLSDDWLRAFKLPERSKLSAPITGSGYTKSNSVTEKINVIETRYILINTQISKSATLFFSCFFLFWLGDNEPFMLMCLAGLSIALFYTFVAHTFDGVIRYKQEPKRW